MPSPTDGSAVADAVRVLPQPPTGRHRVAKQSRKSPEGSPKSSSGSGFGAALPPGTASAAPGGRGRGSSRVAQFLWATRCPSRHPDPAQPCGIARRRVFPCRPVRRPRRVFRHLARQPFGTRRAARCPSCGHDRDPSRSRATRRATTRGPPRPAVARQTRFPRLWRPSRAVVGMPLSARYRGHGVRCLCDASTALRCASQPRHLGQHLVLPSHAGLFVPATSPAATT